MAHDHSTPISDHRVSPAWCYLAAMCSGAAALIYQIVWSKTLALTFGSTTLSAAAVIAAFMIGMGIGARVYGGWDRAGVYPGRSYAFIEFAIALAGLLSSPLLFGFAGFADAMNSLGVAGRFAGAMIILLVPAALMGATFPALCRAVITTDGELRDRIGAVYGFNTLGAALGALAAGFVLVEVLGGIGSTWVAAGLNVFAGIIVLASVRVSRANTVSSPTTRKSERPAVIPEWALTALAFASGMGTLVYEIVWFRGAKYVIGNSTYAMSIVLAVFLLGLGLGGLLERRIARRAFLERDLLLAQMCAALAILLSAGLLYLTLNWPSLRDHISVFAPSFAMKPWPARLGWSLAAAVALLVPPTLVLGLTFPIVTTLVTRTVSRLGRGVGRVYLASSLGATGGAILGALLILPLLGTMGGFKFAASLCVILGLSIAILTRRAVPVRPFLTVILTAGSVALIALLPQRLDFQGELEGGTSRVLFADEGDLATVKVTIASNDVWKAMTIDGYAIGIDRSLPRDITFKQLLLAHLPMVIHPEGRSVLNIGLGSATTQASLASYSGWERIDCVEISQSVVDGARYFADAAALDDPRTHLFVADAIQFLRAGTSTYDAIVADGKQNPQFPGNAALLSREMFESARARLAPGGIMVQWIPLGFPPRAFDVMAQTFASVFDDMSVYYYPPEALILVGGRTGVPARLDQTKPPRFREDLAPYLIETPEQLAAGWLTDGDGLREELRGTPINSWDRPLLEFWPFRDFDIRRSMADKGRNLSLLERARRRSKELSGPENVLALMESAAYVRRGFTRFYESGSPFEFSLRLDSALAQYPDDRLARGMKERLALGPGAVLHSGPL